MPTASEGGQVRRPLRVAPQVVGDEGVEGDADGVEAAGQAVQKYGVGDRFDHELEGDQGQVPVVGDQCFLDCPVERLPVRLVFPGRAFGEAEGASGWVWASWVAAKTKAVTSTVFSRGWAALGTAADTHKVQALTPGKAYTLTLKLAGVDHVVPAGHRLALIVAATDWGIGARPTARRSPSICHARPYGCRSSVN